ncbi:uncharacterized protein BHQ10_000354 [Talaromyces amestolkiae]|uniref:Cysteine dioxygenase n=1 Tax=Talaromyces amestolkiae TaxID=1196081 RepID=A0A364KLC5_TALAM|nr:uncharacterized protein BHQ10_000354 [Talaromyces amestolkiae]RAO64342.1 hypothetical protein BHQ10_000354 [Talaromyces amestolkiae]
MPYLKSDPEQASNNDNAFEKLVQDLSAALGPSSGLDSEDVDPHDIERLMEKYVSDETEWGVYAMSDVSRNYTRNLVDEGNGKSNLLILVWSPGRESAIHDHANAHCVMKILKGSLKETLFSWPEKGQAPNAPLQITKETVYGENQVTYMSDKLGLHRISNMDPNNVAISLHLYTPPNAANYGFSIFDEQTGKSSHIKQCDFYSRGGEKV